MTLDQTVNAEIKADMSLMERVMLYIPGYRGYKKANLRREADRAVRNELANVIQGTKTDLAEIQRGLVTQPNLMLDVERIRTKVDKYETSIKKAVNGYSAFHDALKIDEKDLEALVEWDAKLIDNIQLLRQAASDLLETVDSGADAKAEIRNLERGLDDMMEAYDERDAIMKGISEEA